VKFGENGRLRLLVLESVGMPFIEGGVNGGREVAGEETRFACASFIEFEEAPV